MLFNTLSCYRQSRNWRYNPVCYYNNNSDDDNNNDDDDNGNIF